MPVLECFYNATEGQEMGYIVPMSKISHLSFMGAGKEAKYFLHTMSGATLRISQADYDRLHEIILEQEGVKQ